MAAETNKPNFQYVWASGGAKVAPSDVKIQDGWTAEVPPFQWENWSQNRQDEAILHLFQKGISEWDALSNYYFTSSGVRSYVQGSDGQIYVALQDSVNQNPISSPTFWSLAFISNTNNGLIKSVKRRVFSASGTYTPSPGMVYCDVEIIAGGGGGGGAAGGSGTSAAGGGGGAGGYAKKVFTAAQIGVSQAVTVGAVGTGGAAGNNAGGTGGNTSLGSLLSASGGSGGQGSAALTTAGVPAGGGIGASSTGGDITIRGSNGFASIILGGASGGLSGQGGSSAFGIGGYPSGPTGSGNTGTGNGSGGSGGATNNAGNAAGGQGSPGGIFIVEYCTIV